MTTRREVIAGAAVTGIAALAGTMQVEASTETLPVAAGGIEYPSFDMQSDCRWLSDLIHDWLNDAVLDGGFYPTHVNLTREAYKQAGRGGLIDFIPDAKGTLNIPVIHGLRVFVPGSKLGENIKAPKQEAPFTSFRVAAAPAGVPVFDADANGKHMSERLLDHFNDELLDGRESGSVYITRAAFKQAARDRLLDWVNEEYTRGGVRWTMFGKHNFTVPVLYGRRVYVVVGKF
jgi:hypothetical protein